jgi:hypothetical protein
MSDYSVEHYYIWTQYSSVDADIGDSALELEREVRFQGFCERDLFFRGQMYPFAPIKLESLTRSIGFGKDESIIALANTRADLDALFDIRARVARGRHVNDILRILTWMPEKAILTEDVLEVGSVSIGSRISIVLQKIVDSSNVGRVPSLFTNQRLTPELPTLGQGSGHR